MIYPQSMMRGALFIVASECMIACMGATIKFAAVELPNEMIVFFRNLFGLAALAPWLLRHGCAGLKTGVIHLHMLRAVAGLSAMYCLFFAIAHIKLADAMLLKLTTPVFIPVAALLWLGERLGVAARWALLLGFAGVCLIIRPGAELHWVMLIALVGSAFAALAKVTVRRLSRSEPAFRVVFYFAAMGAVISAVPLVWAWQTPSTSSWLLLLALGPQAPLGKLLMRRGYAAAPAAQVGVFTYSSVLFGAALGWWFWGELWDALSVAGAVLVAAAGALALRGSGVDSGAGTPVLRAAVMPPAAPRR